MNRKKLGIAFGIGVLLCGLGCGIAFAQYSAFDYAGERVIGEKNIVSETVQETIDNDSKLIIYPVGRCDYIDIIADDTVPADKIFFDVEYNSEEINLRVDKEEREKSEDIEEPEIDFYFGDYTNGDDIKEMLMVKDEVLKDLKDRKIGSYKLIDFKSITVRINPANLDRIQTY